MIIAAIAAIGHPAISKVEVHERLSAA